MSELFARPGFQKQFVDENLPVKSKMSAGEAGDNFPKMKNFFGIRIRTDAPGTFRRGMTALFKKEGWWHKVEWMPRLKIGWRRLEFVEFCRLFQIDVKDN